MFTAGIVVPKTLDSGRAGPLAPAIAVNTLLLAMFAVQHGVMARDAFKSRLTKCVPEPLERSVFVIAASSVLGLGYWLWRPDPAVLWDVQAVVAARRDVVQFSSRVCCWCCTPVS